MHHAKHQGFANDVANGFHPESARCTNKYVGGVGEWFAKGFSNGFENVFAPGVRGKDYVTLTHIK